jgi:hypothetical protein
MTDIDSLAYRLAEKHRAMAASNVPPYESEPVELNTGELTLLTKALQLLEAVRFATK